MTSLFNIYLKTFPILILCFHLIKMSKVIRISKIMLIISLLSHFHILNPTIIVKEYQKNQDPVRSALSDLFQRMPRWWNMSNPTLSVLQISLDSIIEKEQVLPPIKALTHLFAIWHRIETHWNWDKIGILSPSLWL